jgi:hypothetical protein
MGGSVGCELTTWYMLERYGVALMGFIWGGRVAVGNSLLVEVGDFKLASILLVLLDTSDAWRYMKDILSTLPTKLRAAAPGGASPKFPIFYMFQGSHGLGFLVPVSCLIQFYIFSCIVFIYPGAMVMCQMCCQIVNNFPFFYVIHINDTEDVTCPCPFGLI